MSSVDEIEEMGSEKERSVSDPYAFSSLDEPIPSWVHLQTDEEAKQG